mgnify:FL=1
MERQEQVIDQLFPQEVFNRLVDLVKRNHHKFDYNEYFGRYGATTEVWKPLMPYFARSLPLAREIFGSETLMPSYALAVHYMGDQAKLVNHKDDNACTYTLDLSLYYQDPWDLVIEDRSYDLKPNQALAFYGEDQEHWRNDFPNPETNYYGAVFFHYVEPDHWFFTGDK